MANVIANTGKPTLVMSHNKTLAAQLYSEIKSFFPDNAVEYFVSYFDYYQPEAYIPRSDTYIEKDSSINEEIERLRLSTMSSLLTRKDVVVVASVSCIYGLGSPEDYAKMMLPVRVGMEFDRDDFLTNLVETLYERNDIAFARGKFRVRGDVVEVFPANLDDKAIRIEFFGDEIERITAFDPLTGNGTENLEEFTLYPAKQFATPADKMKRAIGTIKIELEARIKELEEQGKLLEAQRIRMRTDYDIEMMNEMGFCQGIENYSRHISGREPGATPNTLLDFFPENYLCLMDESHATVPQVGGMYEGDKSRKTTLVDFGFRLPSALDNRPLKFQEFMRKTGQRLYVSATPASFEILNSKPGVKSYIKTGKFAASTAPTIKLDSRSIEVSGAAEPLEAFDVKSDNAPLVVEQIIRPTGLLDPTIEIKPLKGQIDETMELCRQRIAKGQRILVTTLTKRTAEDLTDYLRDLDFKVRYIHADVDAIERVEILRSLRAGECDVLVGINLLREGLDLPEVSLVCILDADKEGYLRSETSLVQTAGRAARHEEGKVILFADQITGSMQRLLDICTYRRERQMAHNEKHGITPKSVVRGIQASLKDSMAGAEVNDGILKEDNAGVDVRTVIMELQGEMQEAATNLDFERAALLRDQINELQKQVGDAPTLGPPKEGKGKSKPYGRGKRRKK